jgi:hypothetical protein
VIPPVLDYDALARLKHLVVAQVAARHYPPGTFSVRVEPAEPGRASVQVVTRCEGRSRVYRFPVPLGEPGRYDDLVAETLGRFLDGE